MINLKENEIVLFSGDSITEGARSRNMDLNHHMGHGFQYILSARMSMENSKKRPKFINKGYSGDNVCAIYGKWYKDVIQNKPTFLNILIGVNDVASEKGGNLTNIINRYANVYEMMLKDTFELLDNPTVVLCEPFLYPALKPDKYVELSPHLQCEPAFTPLNTPLTEKDWEYRMKAIEKVQQVVSELAKKYNCIFVPMQKIFEEAIGEDDAEYFLWDGCHPTIAGHALMAEQWYKCVEEGLSNR